MKRKTDQIKMLAISAILVLSNTVMLNGQERYRVRGTSSQANVAYNRGYGDGYSDGYREGKSDRGQKAARDHQRSQSYQEADRGYEERLGSLADYRDGYRVGFEIAYTDGYYGRTYNQTQPSNATRGAAIRIRDRERYREETQIPDRTVLRLRMVSVLSTKTNQEGDSFTAQVVDQSIYQGATVEGHIAKIERSGRMTGRTEMALDFDTITLQDGRRSPLYAQIEKIYAGESIKTIDDEGNIESASKSKDVILRSAGGAVLGAIIGGIAKGKKGAVIGAIIGAGVGAGSVYIQGNKDLILDAGTEMSVRTTTPLREYTKS
jgi:hypothetical protein